MNFLSLSLIGGGTSTPKLILLLRLAIKTTIKRRFIKTYCSTTNIKVDELDNYIIFDDDDEQQYEKIPVLTTHDYIILVLGARDYDYLISDSKYILDNEVTSLYPVYSYNMLQFILFLLSKKNAMVNHLFDFKPDSKTGIKSQMFIDTVNSVYKRYPLPYDGFSKFYSKQDVQELTYNFASRPFTYLKMPKQFILTPYYLPYEKKGEIKDKYTNLYFNNTDSIHKPYRKDRYKFKRLEDLELVFKTDVLFYLPRFYWNFYTEYHDIKRYHMTYTDKAKQSLNIGLDEETIEKINTNIKRFYEKIGQNSEKIDIVPILKGQNQQGLIKDVNELHEFYLKSILIRRHKSATINTEYNRTNGVYLLHNGVNRFKTIMTTERMQYGFSDYVKIGKKYFSILYKGKKIQMPFKSIVDFDKPSLLSDKFTRLIDRLYKNQGELHLLLKYAQIYLKLFNQFGDNMVYFILANFMQQDTKFDYVTFMSRKSQNNVSRFYKYELLFENKNTIKYMILYLYRSKLITEQKKEFLLGKYNLLLF